VFFLLMTLIVQLGFLVLARNIASTSVDAALRKAVAGETVATAVRQGLERDVRAVVPGATEISVDVTVDQTILAASVRFRWVPPGPDFVPVTVHIKRSIATVVPP
jgi:hypothetical protein